MEKINYVIVRYHKDTGDHIKKYICSVRKVYKFNPRNPKDDYWVEYSDANGTEYQPAQVLDYASTAQELADREKGKNLKEDNGKPKRHHFNRLSISDIVQKLEQRDGPINPRNDEKRQRHNLKSSHRTTAKSGRAVQNDNLTPRNSRRVKKVMNVKEIDPAMAEVLEMRAQNLNELQWPDVNCENLEDVDTRRIDIEKRLAELESENSKLINENKAQKKQITELQKYIEKIESALENMRTSMQNMSAPADGRGSDRPASDSGYAGTSERSAPRSARSARSVLRNKSPTREDIEFFKTFERYGQGEKFEIDNPRNPKEKILMIHVAFGICIAYHSYQRMLKKEPTIFLRRFVSALYTDAVLCHKSVMAIKTHADLGEDSSRYIFTPRTYACMKREFEKQVDSKMKVRTPTREKDRKRVLSVKKQLNPVLGQEVSAAQRRMKKPPQENKKDERPPVLVFNTPQRPATQGDQLNAPTTLMAETPRSPYSSKHARQSARSHAPPVRSITPIANSPSSRCDSRQSRQSARSPALPPTTPIAETPRSRCDSRQSRQSARSHAPPLLGLLSRSNTEENETPLREGYTPESMNGNRSAYTRSVFGNVIPETPSPQSKRHGNVPIAPSPGIISPHSVSNVGSRTTPSRAGATGVRRKSSSFVPKFPIKCQLQSHVRTVDDVIERARTSRSRSRSRLRSRTESARSRSPSLDQKSSQQSAVRSTTPRSSSSCYSSSSNSALRGSSPSLSDDDEDLVDESADGEDVKDGLTDGENAVNESTDGEDIADECDEESVSLLERSKRKKPIPKKARAINYTSDEMDFSD